MKKTSNMALLVLLVLLAVRPWVAQAVDPIPSHRTLFFNTYYPKAGQTGMDIPEGTVRTAARTAYQGWWQEETYYQPNGSNGLPLRGFNMASTVYGGVPLPWTHGVLSNMTSPTAWINLAPGDGSKSGPLYGGGELNWEIPPPGAKGQLYGGTGPLADGFWTPGERFCDQPHGSVAPNETWDGGVKNEDFWNSDNTDLNPLYLWRSLTARKLAGTVTVNEWDSQHGEFYADYNNQTVVNSTTSAVVSLGFSVDTPIYIADTYPGHHTNILVFISGFTVTPPTITGAASVVTFAYPNEGDFTHTPVQGAPGLNLPIGANGKFDHNISSLNPNVVLVYPARGNGVGDGGVVGKVVYAKYQSYMSASVKYLSGVANDAYYQYADAGNGAVPPASDYADNGGKLCTVYVPIYQAGELWGIPTPNGQGLPVDAGDGVLNQYQDYVTGYAKDNQWTGGQDHEPFEDFLSWWMPTGGSDGKGAWVDAIVGYEASPNYTNHAAAHSGVTPISKHMGNPNSMNAITYTEYCTYIRHNYPNSQTLPGNIDLLIGRCANGVYDGPDNWKHVSSASKMQWKGNSTTIQTPAPGQYGDSGWDPYDQYGEQSGWNGNSSGWWQKTFETYSSETQAPSWQPMLPLVTLWQDYPTNSVADTNGTNSATWYPPQRSTWGYNGTREFEDLPSSFYHSGGDMRLGEPTDPWTYSISGADHGGNTGAYANMTPDHKIPSCGPLAYDVHGCNGLDAGNQMNLELLTWRTDGKNYTGPRDGGHVSGPYDQPRYTHDHRDRNLDGLIDLGETIPENSQNYSVGPSSGGANSSGGRETPYPFNWQRYFEDCIAVWDDAVDFNSMRQIATADLPMLAWPGFDWTGTRPVASSNDLDNVRWHYNGAIPHSGFDPELDDVWFATGHTNYTSEMVINIGSAEGGIADGTVGSSLVAKYFDFAGAGMGPFDINGLDFAWNDINNDGFYNTDLVLADNYNQMQPGETGTLINDAGGANSNAVVCYQAVGGGVHPHSGDNFWIQNLGTNVTPLAGNYDAVADTVLYTGAALTNGTPRSGIVANVYYFARHAPDAGFVVGDDVWVATIPGRFTAEQPIYAPNGLRIRHVDASGVELSGSNLANVAYVDRNLSGAFEYNADDTWLENTPTNRIYDQDSVLINHGALTNQASGATLDHVAYSSTYNVYWQDKILNGVYDPSTLPIYLEGWACAGIGGEASTNSGGGENGGGGSLDIGPHLSGNTYSVPTRDGGGNLSGYSHVWPANLDFTGATHEQGHELCDWADYYDFNVWGVDQGAKHFPVGAYDLMAVGSLVHGIESTKERWMTPQSLNSSSQPILMAPGLGPQTLRLYPADQQSNPDQYYKFINPSHPDEFFAFWYVCGQSRYSVYPGAQGIMISHGNSPQKLNNYQLDGPKQQRFNYQFSDSIVQADGLYQMEDGLNSGDVGDLWTTQKFTENSIPPARWWDQSPAGIRIVNIVLPSEPLDAALVTFEWVNETNTAWYWTGPSLSAMGNSGNVTSNTNGSDSSSNGSGTTATPAPGVGAGTGGGFFTPRAGGNRGCTTGSGIPDAWVLNWFGNYVNPLSICSATSDYDNDGLCDYAEWLAHLNPMDKWSWDFDQDLTLTDADADLTGDRISDLDKYKAGLNMREPDSDDDGFSDADELNPAKFKPDQTGIGYPAVGSGFYRRTTSPVYSRSPLIERSLHLAKIDQLAIPSWEIGDSTRFQVTNWTVEGWVKLDGTNSSGTLVTRVTPQGGTNFEVGVSNNIPYALFSTDGGNVYRTQTDVSGMLASNTWVHLAGMFSQSNRSLRLYQDGSLAASITVNELPSIGHPSMKGGALSTGSVKLGGGFNGFVDEIRIWASDRSPDKMAKGYDKIINTPWISGVVVVNGISSVVTTLVNSVGNDGTLISNLRFDDGQNTNIINRLDGTVHKGGIEDWVHPLGPNEGVYWNGGDRTANHGYCVQLVGSAALYLATNDSDVVQCKLSALQASPIDDLNEDGIPDWWQVFYWPAFNPTQIGPWDAMADPDGDGVANIYEYQMDTNPLDSDTNQNGIGDSGIDSDGDGISDVDELSVFHTNASIPDTDDDGFIDGEEVGGVASLAKTQYGVQNVVSGPTDSLSPWIPRSLILGKINSITLSNTMASITNGIGGIPVPYSQRFTFITNSLVSAGPRVTITQPSGSNATSTVRFMTVQGTVNSSRPLNFVRLYDNGALVTDLTLTNNSFSYTMIIRANDNLVTVLAADAEGFTGQAETHVTGSFATADIRVTQTWDQNGDLDTWLIDPQGRHMGFSSGGPGYPANAGSGHQIPGANLDIDNTSGMGPENITVASGSAIPGVYQVWMDNFSNHNNANSSVRVLINEGGPHEQYIAYGPHPMPVSDGDSQNPAAWWHVTDVVVPAGYTPSGTVAVTVSQAGTPISTIGAQTLLQDQSVGFNTTKGLTVEAWIKPGNTNQTGAIARYVSGGADTLVVGLSNNCPYMMVRSSGNNRYELTCNAIASNEWTHVAFVVAEGHSSIRIHVNASLMCARTMLESRKSDLGQMFIDAPLVLGATTNSFTLGLLDEVRFWSVARSGAVIDSTMHSIFVDNETTLVAGYHFDDGGLGIEEMTHPTNRRYDLGGYPLPDVLTDAKPGPDGIWGTSDDIPAGAGADKQNDFVTATDWAPVYGLRSTANNGLPDWFSQLYGGGASIKPLEDLDRDELDNQYEYWCGTNPLEWQTRGSGVTDSEADFNGDGLSNLGAQQAGLDPRLGDTLNDGIADAMRVRNGWTATSTPISNRCLAVDGALTSYVYPPASTRFELRSFDISAWVCPTSKVALSAASIVARQTEPGLYNYNLGVSAALLPFISFNAGDNNALVTLQAPATSVLTTNTWTFLRAVFDAASGNLTLYVGSYSQTASTEKLPKTEGLGPVTVRIGAGFKGLIDGAAIRGDPATVLAYDFNNALGTNTPSGMTGKLGWKPGGQVMDASQSSQDWLNHWVHAGTLAGGAAIVEAPPGTPTSISTNSTNTSVAINVSQDTDGDGIPDFWEYQYYQDQNMYDAQDDFADLDGWDNFSEYMAGASPVNGGSHPTPPLMATIWYAGATTVGNLNIEAYTTPLRDGTPDAVYRFGLGVGAMQVAGTVIVVAAAPVGSTTLSLAAGSANTLLPGPTYLQGVGMAANTYAVSVLGTNGTSGTVVVAISSPTIAAIGSGAALTAMKPMTANYPQSFLVTNAASGYLRQGTNWFFAYMDLNGNNHWEAGEPCGYAVYQPVNVSWSAVPVDIHLQTSPIGFPRIDWTLPSSVTSVSRVRVEYGHTVGSNIVYDAAYASVDLSLRAPRNYLTEADLVNLGTPSGMGSPGYPTPTDWTYRYRWSVMFDPSGPSPVTYVPSTAYTVFTQSWTSASFKQPSIVYPLNEAVSLLPVYFVWTAGSDVPAFTLAIRSGSSTGTVVMSSVVRPASYLSSGSTINYVYYPQWNSAQFLSLTNGVYYWQVTPSIKDSPLTLVSSAWSQFTLDTTGGTDDGVGPFSISGTLSYGGKVSNHAVDQLVLTGVGGATHAFSSVSITNNMFVPNSLPLAGSLSLRLLRGTTNLVTFIDTGASFSNLSSVTLVTMPVDGTNTFTGWFASTCVVNYVSGKILSVSFPAGQTAPTTNDHLLATYDYQRYPFVVQAYPLYNVPGWSGKPWAQSSSWQKGSFTLTGLPRGAYTLLAFIDQVGDGCLHVPPETWGFVRGSVPTNGPGYQQIGTILVGPSTSTTITMRDVDSNNNGLPDAWEVEKFGAIGLHGASDIVNGQSVAKMYASMQVTPDVVALRGWSYVAQLLGFDSNYAAVRNAGTGVSYLEAYVSGDNSGATHWAIPTITKDASGNPEIQWTSPQVYAGTQLRYTVLRATDLLSGSWSIVTEVVVSGGTGAQTQTYVDFGAPTGAFYKLQVDIQ